ncbi:hypothetical protein Vretifemale_1813, partial [Volvox reticuliferus]
GTSKTAMASDPLLAAGGSASHVTRFSARPLQSCVTPAAHRSSDPSDSSLSPSLPPLVELTSSEAARFFMFTASAEVTSIEAADSRREQVVQHWRELQQRALPLRARSLLVFFLNRAFHHCARLMLAFLLRHMGVASALANAITCPSDEGIAILAEISEGNPSLDLAVQLDGLPRVFELLAHQVRTETGLGLLHHAVRSGSLETVELVLLLSRRANAPLNVLEQDPDGITPAHLAALLPDCSAAITEALVAHATRVATKGLHNIPAAAAAAVTTFQPAQAVGTGGDFTTAFSRPTGLPVVRDRASTTIPPISSTCDISTVAMLGTELERMVLRSGAVRKSGGDEEASDVAGCGVGPGDVPESPSRQNALREIKSSSQAVYKEELVSARSSVQSWSERSTEGPQPCATAVAAPVSASTLTFLGDRDHLGGAVAMALAAAAAAAVLALLPSSGPNRMLLSAAIVVWCLTVLWLAAASVTRSLALSPQALLGSARQIIAAEKGGGAASVNGVDKGS